MSFPSIERLAAERNIDLKTVTGDTARTLLLDAVRVDCPEAIHYLHALAHQAEHTDNGVTWLEDPNSVLGKQLIRIHASDAIRPLVEQHICHGQRLTFYNCCGGKVGGRKPDDDEAVIMQVQSQGGPIAFADC
jgi:hypothetical protein